ncbi:shikimate kinase [Mammaliicoccus sciuri]|uniref:shikimate kinase n=1 Tax=Mammaliicoccus sciuri TaxID=1296 RepID=UPI0007347A94|nr:shikimate kinase [Mammaliicoccus sciuri]KTT83484.1 shikimate kinase [Mammaliicoccus sciuri]MBA1396591.1 AAA family ATPase [Mammaliicoccus sciuri]MBF0719409.1 shikimate kinase [Mammaliicoccus sciuri]MBG9205067.1 shikimate kinase [Mammaliicoccus sciuri]MBO1208428.1 shikimate kinase [Mammaliicoccus sciuri]
MSIVLIGFMGVGKTTIGNLLSEHYDKSIVDIDTYIVETTQLPIPQIFEKYGEKHFRDLEYEALKKWIDQDVIISTGGGIVESELCKELLKQNDNTFWLKCDVEILFNRINHDNNRPNANGKSLNELKALYSKRELSYNEIAFKHIDANRPREVVASEIIESL